MQKSASKYKNNADISFVCQSCFASFFVRAAHGTCSGTAPALVSYTIVQKSVSKLSLQRRVCFVASITLGLLSAL